MKFTLFQIIRVAFISLVVHYREIQYLYTTLSTSAMVISSVMVRFSVQKV